MYARTALIVSIALVLVLASVCAFGAATYRVVEKPVAFLLTGTAVNIDRLREFVEISDRGNVYTILTGRATIHLADGKIGNTQELKDSAYIQVSGEQLSARTVLADAVVVLDERTAAVENKPLGYQPNDRVEATGSVTGVVSGSEIDVRTSAGNYALAVRPDTVIRRYIYVTDISDVNEGDDVSFTGRMGDDGRIIAERIQVSASGSTRRTTVSKGYRPTYTSAVSHSREDSIEGAITSPPSSFDRSLALDTEYGERKIDVLKSAEVRIDKLPASVHDLSKGDHVRVFGTWDGDTLIASRVETYDPSSSASYRVQQLRYVEPAPATPEPPAQPTAPPAETAAAPANPTPEPPAPASTTPPAAPQPANPNVITGRIVSIDYTNFDLSVDAGLKDNKIDARDAAVTREGSTRRFSELKKGDKVEVKGDWNGDVLKATSVDVVE